MQVNYGVQTQYCTEGCGYNVKLQKAQHSGTIVEQATGDRLHRYKCSVCGDLIKTESCTNTNGERLGCSTGIIGECIVCNATYDNTKHGAMRGGKCHTCGKKFYDCTIKREIVDETTSKYTWHYVATEEGLEIINNPTYMAYGVTPAPELIESNVVINDDGSIDVIKIFKAKHSTIARASIASVLDYKYDGYTGGVIDYADELPPDNYAPTVKNITVIGADSQTEFSRSAKITAVFEETWDSIVEMALFDNDGTVISNWSTASKEGTTFTKEFNVLTETTTSKELTVKAKDRCGNVGEGKVTIGKIDTKAPELISKTNYNDTWRISLPIRIEATDEGAGNVQIGLGSEADYQLGTKEGNKYYIDYNFVGDVYEDLVRIVYLKDEVGNVVTKRITIGKLDKTSPTITNISSNNRTITIEANDINTKLNKEGSGIKGYAISKSREVPADNNFQASNIFTVEEAGIYYIWAKDNAGNFSETKQIQVN